MIRLTRPTLQTNVSGKLNDYQSTVNAESDYTKRVALGKELFAKHNKKGNATFDAVKAALLGMSCGAERCHYCEDSKADEVEHLHPKDVYPESVFDWSNYFYACGGCNNPAAKGNHCAVIDLSGQLIDCTPPPTPKKTMTPIVRIVPPIGIKVFIDPATENPLDFFFLDIQNNTFELTEFPDPITHPVEYSRANYTLEKLKLSTRAYLNTARRNAYGSFKARLNEYIKERNLPNPSQVVLSNMINELKGEAHQTVWQEMKRQHQIIPELHTLFSTAPEALNW